MVHMKHEPEHGDMYVGTWVSAFAYFYEDKGILWCRTFGGSDQVEERPWNSIGSSERDLLNTNYRLVATSWGLRKKGVETPAMYEARVAAEGAA